LFSNTSIDLAMTKEYNDIDNQEAMALGVTKNDTMGQAPVSAVEKRRAALEELDEAKFSVSTVVYPFGIVY
jgi:hypothetical protein